MSRKLTTEEFITKAKEVHGNKYDYSKVKYIDTHTDVCIICPEHGEFWQRPHNHLNGKGCPKCIAPNYGMTTEEFVEKARKVHGNKYDYSKVHFVNMSTPVTLICPVHGEFQITPEKHLHGSKSCHPQGCRKCGTARFTETCRDTLEIFLKKYYERYPDSKYDFSESKYINSSTKMVVICHEIDKNGKEHGAFMASPNSLMSGHGCKKCSSQKAKERQTMTKDEFIKRAEEIHGKGHYNYDKVEYVNANTPVIIHCPTHGDFKQTPSAHLHGRGCWKCAGSNPKTTEDFIAESKAMYGEGYFSYPNTVYVNANTPVKLVCPVHGEYEQLPGVHLRGKGCPLCNRGLPKKYKFNLLQEFADEFKFRAFLANNDINILLVILGSLCELEPKYAPLERDIEKALEGASTTDPMDALVEKYTSETETEEDETVETTTTVDLDNEEEVYKLLTTATEESDEEQHEPSIEDVIKSEELDQEIQVINRIEHMLTPDIRKKIMDKYLNDKRRLWMAARDANK